MYKKILVPLDGSSASEAILSHVENLAQRGDSALYFLEVLEPLPQHAAAGAPSMFAEGAGQRAADIKHYVHDMAEKFSAQGLTSEALVRRGAVVDTILHTADELGVDLIAMATHGHSGFARLLYGSVAADVLHRAKAAMLILRIEPTD
ncbi:MAG: universal stress protein [Caldilineaceae bacterium]|nr:universal stress protein [Caldilineaceae bacterium]